MWETLIPWIIAISILVLLSLFAYFLKDQLAVLGGKFTGLFRHG